LTRTDDAIANARRAALTARRALNSATRTLNSTIIAERVVRSHEFAASGCIACYLPADDEVDPRLVIARAWTQKKHVFAPAVLDDFVLAFRMITPDTQLVRNRYGLWEPDSSSLEIAAQDIDIVLTPVVAFDDERHRIGMGSGYFDRCFAFLRHRNHWLRPKLVGLAFECQRVKKIKPNPWDIRLYRVITENRRTNFGTSLGMHPNTSHDADS